jgi:hypothetical protein
MAPESYRALKSTMGYVAKGKGTRLCGACEHHKTVTYRSGTTRNNCEQLGVFDLDEATVDLKGQCRAWKVRHHT